MLAYHHQYDGCQKAQGFLQNFTASHDVVHAFQRQSGEIVISIQTANARCVKEDIQEIDPFKPNLTYIIDLEYSVFRDRAVWEIIPRSAKGFSFGTVATATFARTSQRPCFSNRRFRRFPADLERCNSTNTSQKRFQDGVDLEIACNRSCIDCRAAS